MITLSPWSRADRSASERWVRDDLPSEWFVYPSAIGPRRCWAILSDINTVGRITLRDITDISATIGIYVEPLSRGRGYAVSALDLFLSGQHELTWLYADIANSNVRSLGLFLSAGFVVYGTELRSFGSSSVAYSLLSYSIGVSNELRR